jgi:hypothetical protein
LQAIIYVALTQEFFSYETFTTVPLGEKFSGIHPPAILAALGVFRAVNFKYGVIFVTRKRLDFVTVTYS